MANLIIIWQFHQKPQENNHWDTNRSSFTKNNKFQYDTQFGAQIPDIKPHMHVGHYVIG